MRILHTADWHIGQTLNGWSREHEHQAFFHALRDVIVRDGVDVLLIAGDEFDGINPSGDPRKLGRLLLRSSRQGHDQGLPATECCRDRLAAIVYQVGRQGLQGERYDKHQRVRPVRQVIIS